MAKLLAVEAVKRVHAENLRIPEEISVIGSDIANPLILGIVPLTTVVQDFFEMGRAANANLPYSQYDPMRAIRGRHRGDRRLKQSSSTGFDNIPCLSPS